MTRHGLPPDGEIPLSKPVDPDAVPEESNATRGIYDVVAGAALGITATWLWSAVPGWRVAVVITAVVLGGLLILLAARRRR